MPSLSNAINTFLWYGKSNHFKSQKCQVDITAFVWLLWELLNHLVLFLPLVDETVSKTSKFQMLQEIYNYQARNTKLYEMIALSLLIQKKFSEVVSPI